MTVTVSVSQSHWTGCRCSLFLRISNDGKSRTKPLCNRFQGQQAAVRQSPSLWFLWSRIKTRRRQKISNVNQDPSCTVSRDVSLHFERRVYTAMSRPLQNGRRYIIHFLYLFNQQVIFTLWNTRSHK